MQLQFDNKYFVVFFCVFTAVDSDSELRSAFGCRKLIREMLHGPEVWICRLLFNSCISLCCQEGASVKDALWSLLHYYSVLWLRKTGAFMYSKKPPKPKQQQILQTLKKFKALLIFISRRNTSYLNID